MKFLLYFLCLTGLMQPLLAKDWTLELRGACYLPTSQEAQSIYSRAWLESEVFTAKKLNQYLEAFGQVSWTVKKGQTSRGEFGFKDRSRIWILPLTAGLRVVYPIATKAKVYAGAGISYSYLKIENRYEDIDYYFYSSSPFHKQIYEHHLGALWKTGLLIDTGDHTYLDFFVDYAWQTFRLKQNDLFADRIVGHQLNLSGVKVGAGFGVNF